MTKIFKSKITCKHCGHEFNSNSKSKSLRCPKCEKLTTSKQVIQYFSAKTKGIKKKKSKPKKKEAKTSKTLKTLMDEMKEECQRYIKLRNQLLKKDLTGDQADELLGELTASVAHIHIHSKEVKKIVEKQQIIKERG